MSFPWWAWAIAAVLIGLAELHAPGSYLIWIAFGAAITGLIALAKPLSIEAQVAIFAFASMLSCVVGYFVYHRAGYRGKNDTLNQRDQSLIGARGSVSDAFLHGRGKVRLGDTVWLAEGPDLAEGAPIVVTGVRGTAVIVAPLTAS